MLITSPEACMRFLAMVLVLSTLSLAQTAEHNTTLVKTCEAQKGDALEHCAVETNKNDLALHLFRFIKPKTRIPSPAVTPEEPVAVIPNEAVNLEALNVGAAIDENLGKIAKE